MGRKLFGRSEECANCDSGTMHECREKKGSNAVAFLLSVLMIIIGIWLCLSIVGAILGLPLIAYGLFHAAPTQDYMECDSCGYNYDIRK